MRVVLPYIYLDVEVAEALDASGYDWDSVDVSGSDEAYWEVLSDLWSYGKTFAIVEQDIKIGPATLKSFDACPHERCASPYPYLGGMYAGLGCTRFRGSLIRGLPHLMDEVAEMSNHDHPKKFWCTLDAWMQIRFTACQIPGPCLHAPVKHLGSHMPAHGCVK